MKILIIDENPFDLITLEKVFKGKGSIVKTKNHQEGLTLIKEAYVAQSPYDLIFLSTTLPTQDGISLLKEIRTFEDSKGIAMHTRSRFIMITDLIDLVKVAESFHYLCDAYLTRPLGEEQLHRKLDFLYNDGYSPKKTTSTKHKIRE